MDCVQISNTLKKIRYFKDLIKEKICLTQDDLQQGLLSKGYEVTQSTISRDIKELKLVKGRDADGNYRYLSNIKPQTKSSSSHYHDFFVRAVKSIDYSLNNVVIKCDNGMAMSVCVTVDELFGDMMLGSLAGDDTIIIVTSGEHQSKLLSENLKKLL